MASNVYTKNEILQNLASKGYFIDAYTLDTFFEKWKVEAIFEDEQGSEFYDKNALDLVMDNLFNSPNETTSDEQEEPRMLKEPVAQEIPQQVQQPMPQLQQNQFQQQPQFNQQMAQQQPQFQQYQQYQPYPQPQQPQQMYQPYQQPMGQMPYQQQPMPQYQQPIQQQIDMSFNDAEANSILNNISLSDGSSLMSKVQDTAVDAFVDYEQLRREAVEELGLPTEPEIESIFAKEEKKIGILEGAMQAASEEISSELGLQGIYEEPTAEPTQAPEQAENKEETKAQVIPPGTEVSEFDDMNLLNDSLEAQERFREYVVSELSRKNFDVTPKDNEFKLDISERTINMVARSMAKKIASHVSKIFAQNNGNSAELAKVQKENKMLEQKTHDLEEQIKKLKMLLAESNKNLNSYKPSIFGLYKKVPPGQ